MTEQEFFSRMHSIDKKYLAEAEERAVSAASKEPHRRIPFGAAACIVFGLGILTYLLYGSGANTLISQNDISSQIMTATTPQTTQKALAQTTSASAASTTKNTVSQTTISAANPSAQTETSATETVTETLMQQTTALTSSVTEAAQSTRVQTGYQPGDVDMDGDITYADAYLARTIFSYTLWEKQNELQLTQEQLALADVTDAFENEGTRLIRLSDLDENREYGDRYRVMHAADYPVTDPDIKAILWTVVIRQHFGQPDLSVSEYLQQKDYYDNMIMQNQNAWLNWTDLSNLYNSQTDSFPDYDTLTWLYPMKWQNVNYERITNKETYNNVASWLHILQQQKMMNYNRSGAVKFIFPDQFWEFCFLFQQGIDKTTLPVLDFNKQSFGYAHYPQKWTEVQKTADVLKHVYKTE